MSPIHIVLGVLIIESDGGVLRKKDLTPEVEPIPAILKSTELGQIVGLKVAICFAKFELKDESIATTKY